MSAVKALIFGIDDLFPKLKPYYDREVEKGNLEIVGYVIFEGDKILLVKNLQREPLQNLSFQKIIRLLNLYSRTRRGGVYRLIMS